MGGENIFTIYPKSSLVPCKPICPKYCFPSSSLWLTTCTIWGLPDTVPEQKNGGLSACGHKGQIHEAVAGEKAEGFIQMLRDLGEWRTPCLKPISSPRP